MNIKAKEVFRKKISEFHKAMYSDSQKSTNDRYKILGFMDAVLDTIQEEELTDPEISSQLTALRQLVMGGMKKGERKSFTLLQGNETILMTVTIE